MTTVALRSGLARLATTFSIATLVFASPVYLRLVENPGAALLVRLALFVQILPALVLALIDLTLARLAAAAVWRTWRKVLYLLALMSIWRQAQLSFRPKTNELPVGETVLLAAGVVVLFAVVALAYRLTERFLVAFAPLLVVWTLSVGSTIVALAPPARAGTARAPRPPPSPVFVLLFDELDPAIFMRGGRVGGEWPAFRRITEMSVAFTDATANYGNTCPSVAALLTGRLLPELPPIGNQCLERVTDLRTNNVLSDLSGEYEVRVYGQYLQYCFDARFRCHGTAHFQAIRPSLPLLQHWLPNPLRAALGVVGAVGYSEHTYALPLFEHFLADIDAATAPGRVYYLHLVLPHGPYVFDETGRLHAPAHGGEWRDEREHAEVLRDYVRQARFVDRLLGRFLDRLDAAGLTGRSVIVVTSDHGFRSYEPFGPPRFVDGIEVNNARQRVPLTLHVPGIAPARVSGYQHVDFRRILMAALRGDGAALVRDPGRGFGGRRFCWEGVWYAEDGGGRWARRGAGPPDGCRTTS